MLLLIRAILGMRVFGRVSGFMLKLVKTILFPWTLFGGKILAMLMYTASFLVWLTVQALLVLNAITYNPTGVGLISAMLSPGFLGVPEFVFPHLFWPIAFTNGWFGIGSPGVFAFLVLVGFAVVVILGTQEGVPELLNRGSGDSPNRTGDATPAGSTNNGFIGNVIDDVLSVIGLDTRKKTVSPNIDDAGNPTGDDATGTGASLTTRVKQFFKRFTGTSSDGGSTGPGHAPGVGSRTNSNDLGPSDDLWGTDAEDDDSDSGGGRVSPDSGPGSGSGNFGGDVGNDYDSNPAGTSPGSDSSPGVTPGSTGAGGNRDDHDPGTGADSRSLDDAPGPVTPGDDLNEWTPESGSETDRDSGTDE